MGNNELISTLDLTDSTSIVFSVSLFHGKKYISLAKCICGSNSEKPIFAGGINVLFDHFKELNDLLTKNTENILEATEKNIGKIEVKDSEEIQVSIVSYQGRVGVDIRKYLVNGDAKTPTKKGIRIPIEQADELLECFESVCDKIGG